MHNPHPPRTFIRLVHLQARAFSHGHKRWAQALGQRLREMRHDYPELRAYD